jgi:hypothetical protein
VPFTQLFVWVEGPDDQRFVDTILRPRLEELYDWVEVVPYSGMANEKITKWIESIRSINDATYAFLADNDQSACVPAKKEELVRRIKSLQPSRIVIVVEEIEAWYLAGLAAEGRERLGINEMANTDNVNKEAFDLHRRPDYGSRVDWMIEMLRHYSLEEGCSRNSSLGRFVARFISRLA